MRMFQTARWVRSTFAAAALLAPLTLLASACGSSERPNATSTTPASGCTDNDGDGYGVGCALGADCNDNDRLSTDECRLCMKNEPGCACANEGKRIECGKVTKREGNEVTCYYGAQTCVKGKWSQCGAGDWAPGHDGYVTTKALSKPLEAGSCDDCDPNCHIFKDTPDDLDGGPSNLLPDGGFLWPSGNANAPTPAELAARGADGGFPDGGIFKTLLPGQTSAAPGDPVNVVDPRPAGGDVYFLVDDTPSMGAVAASLASSIANNVGGCVPDPAGGQMAAAGGGIVQNLKCKFGDDVFVGLGRFEDYNDYAGRPVTPSGDAFYPAATLRDATFAVPYEHILSMQTLAAPAQGAVTYYGTTSYRPPPDIAAGTSVRGFGDIAEAAVPAMFAALTGNGLPRTAALWWTGPRSSWSTGWKATTGYTSVSTHAPDLTGGACGANTVGYPCFRGGSTPIFVVFTDAPSHNGPGGQYAYPQYTMDFAAALDQPATLGAKKTPRSNEAPNVGNNAAVQTDPATATILETDTDATGKTRLKPRLYWGTVQPTNAYAGGTNPPPWPSKSSINLAPAQAAVRFGDWSGDGFTTTGDPSTDANSGKRRVRDCTNNSAVSQWTTSGFDNITVTSTTVTAPAPTYGVGSYDVPWPDARPYRALSPGANGLCGAPAVTWQYRCGTTAPYVSGSADATTYVPVASFSGAAQYTVNPRLLVGGNVDLRIDGATGGTSVLPAPITNLAKGTRIDLRFSMTDTAQAASPNAIVRAGVNGNIDFNNTRTNATPALQTIYADADNATVNVAFRTSTPNVRVQLDIWVTPPDTTSCAGILSYSRSARPKCLTCASGYASSTVTGACTVPAGTACGGTDNPQCSSGGFAPKNANGGCNEPASTPTAARTRALTASDAWVLGDCFSCPAAASPLYSYESGAPRIVTQRNATSNGQNVGCFIPGCANATAAGFADTSWAGGTAYGAGWQFDQGGNIATNTSNKCVRTTAAADLTCASSATVCSGNIAFLCNTFGGSSGPGWTQNRPLVPGGTSAICRCANMDGSALQNSLVAGGATGLTATYFGTAPNPSGSPNGTVAAPMSGGSWGWTNPVATRNEANLDSNANGWPPEVSGTNNFNFSARWTGQVEVPCAGTYQFAAAADDDVRLWIDDRMVINRRGYINGNPQWTSTPDNLPVPSFTTTVANQRLNVKMELAQQGGGALARLFWRKTSAGTCPAAGIAAINTEYVVPVGRFTNTYVEPSVAGARAQCVTQGNYAATTTTSRARTVGPGGWNAESYYKFTVPAGRTFYYHFALLKTDNVFASTSDKTFLYLRRESDLGSGEDTGADGAPPRSGPVVDCNVSAAPFSADSRGAARAVAAEINGRVGPGTYYLIIDNWATSTQAYNYVLQVNQFDDVGTLPAGTPTPTAPSYDQLVQQLTAKGAKIIGVENSGVSCSQANRVTTSLAQFETREHLEKIAYDTGSVDENGKPIVVSLRQDASACGRDPTDRTAAAGPVTTDGATIALPREVNKAVNTLANTLRLDLVLRATRTGAAPSPDIDPLNAAFAAEDFVDAVTADPNSVIVAGNSRCGAPPGNPTLAATGADFDPSFVAPRTREMFNACLPGAPVRFNVRFRVPASIQRTSVPQYFRFDLTVAPVVRDVNNNKSAGTPLARIPVVIKVPEATAGTASLERDYDANEACSNGYRPVWDGFGYDTYTPSDVLGSDSKIEFFWSTADTQAGLAPAGSAGERLFATATRITPTPACGTVEPPTLVRSEACDRVALRKYMLAAGELPNRRFVRIRMKLGLSADNVNAPTLKNWKMFLDCVPYE